IWFGNMRIIFMGSAPLACPSLEILLNRADDEVVGVITQPDRPKGRNRRISSCAVKIFAEQNNLPVQTPEKINSPESVELLRTLKPDLIIVFAYGQILGLQVLELPSEGCVNVHASLLPKYRGAAPIQWAIVNGEEMTGVTTMYMAEGMDDGDIILQREIAIKPEDTAGLLSNKMAKEGAELLGETLDMICGGNAVRKPQNEDEATFAPKIKKEDGRIDWTKTAEEIYNRIRGFNPWPTCWCCVRSQKSEVRSQGRIRVLKTRVEDREGEPGKIIDVGGDGPLVGTGNGCVRLLEIQPEGKKPMSGAAYVCGYSLKTGVKL
ncbi:methionyl-tRNA formyltransferase, partial [Verrucomicrobiota bacterium]